MDADSIIIATLATVAIGGIFFAFVYPILSGDARAEKRQANMASAARGSGANARAVDRSQDIEKRRKQVVDSLKEIEQKGKSKKLTLEAKLRQAGLEWPKRNFYYLSAGLGVGVAALVFMISGELLYVVPGFFVGALGLSNWTLAFLRKRRLKKFLLAFPDAIDIIIRGVRAGLPLGDCLRVIASESVEPVRGEFRQIIESTTMGLALGEAVDKLYERVPISETNFFSIVINVQQKAGGNLSEALANLSRVLRERKKMAGKVQAMASEAKASAGIIGCLPFCVTGLLYLSSPRYIELLWLTSTGRTVMAVAGFWMFIGVMSMKKMINFDM